MTPDVARAAEIRARADAATPGEWVEMCMGSEGYHVYERVSSTGKLRRKLVARCTYEDWETDKANAELIAAARSDVPWLLDRLAEAASEIERAKDERRRAMEGRRSARRRPGMTPDDLARVAAIRAALDAFTGGIIPWDDIRWLLDRLAAETAEVQRLTEQIRGERLVHTIQEQQLREEHNRAPRWDEDRIVIENDWLDGRCPRCGEPISADTVEKTDALMRAELAAATERARKAEAALQEISSVAWDEGLDIVSPKLKRTLDALKGTDRG